MVRHPPPAPNTVVKQTCYTLNRHDAIQKKITASHRDAITLEDKGGGLVATFNAGTYEAMKKALLEFFAPQIAQGEVSICSKVDQENSNTDISIKVIPPPSYVINMYHTQSRALINGKGQHLFPTVLDSIAKNLDYDLIDNINTMLQDLAILDQAHQQIRRSERQRNPNRKYVTEEPPSPKRPGQGKHSKLQQAITAPAIPEITDECPLCGHSVQSEGPMCSICHSHFHFGCVDFSEEELNEIELFGDKYTCNGLPCLARNHDRWLCKP
jgi:hypothetical protein